MPPVRVKLRLTVLPAPRCTVIAPLARTEGTLNENALGGPICGSPEPTEQDPQHRVGVGGGADRGAGVGTHPLLVDDDRGRQPLEHVDVGPRQCRHETLHEGAVGLVDQPLGLRGDRAEHQRALARTGDAGEHRQPALRDLDADIPEVVDPRAVHADQVVAVGKLRRGRRRVRDRGISFEHHATRCLCRPVRTHRSCISPRTLPSRSVKVATRRPPTSRGGSFTVAPAAVTSASFASMSATCQ